MAAAVSRTVSVACRPCDHIGSGHKGTFYTGTEPLPVAMVVATESPTAFAINANCPPALAQAITDAWLARGFPVGSIPTLKSPSALTLVKQLCETSLSAAEVEVKLSDLVEARTLEITQEDAIDMLTFLDKTVGHRYTQAQVVRFANVVHTNYWHVGTPVTGKPMGVGLYRTTSFFNHSCAPNLRCSFGPDGTIAFATIRPVQPEEELTISYRGEMPIQTATRHASLLTTMGFHCKCKRCVLETSTLQSRCYGNAPGLDATLIPAELGERTLFQSISSTLQNEDDRTAVASALALWRLFDVYLMNSPAAVNVLRTIVLLRGGGTKRLNSMNLTRGLQLAFGELIYKTAMYAAVPPNNTALLLQSLLYDNGQVTREQLAQLMRTEVGNDVVLATELLALA